MPKFLDPIVMLQASQNVLQTAPVEQTDSVPDGLIVGLAAIFAVLGLSILLTKQFRDQRPHQPRQSDRNVEALFERVTNGQDLENPDPVWPDDFSQEPSS